MDFFSHQDQAKKSSKILVGLFATAVLVMVIALNIIALLVIPKFFATSALSIDKSASFFDRTLFYMQANPFAFVMFSTAILGFIGLGSLYKIFALSRSGGRGVARLLGGRLVNHEQAQGHERQLLNVVEEMAIASGISVPAVYILDDQAGINAFAAGFSIDDAVIGVTSGALESLNRDELQGVVAHEFSHIFHGDMNLNMKVIGVLHGILLLGYIGEFLIRGPRYSTNRYSSRRGKQSGQIVLLGLGLFATGYIGYFFGLLIKSAISRQREYLADASAVQYTRSPDGIANALKKIGGLSTISHQNVGQISHMFFAKSLNTHLDGLFATHPPIANRIQRLDRSFKPESQPAASPQQRTDRDSLVSGFSSPSISSSKRPASANLTQSIGSLTRSTIDKAHQIHEAIADEIHAACASPKGAPLVVTALINPKLETSSTDDNEWQDLLPKLDQVDDSHRLPIVDLCIPTLKALAENDRIQLLKRLESHHINSTSTAVASGDLFPYILYKILQRHLLPKSIASGSKMKLINAATVALSALSTIGHEESSHAADSAYRQSMQRLLQKSRIPRRVNFSLNTLDQALASLSQAKNKDKRHFIAACEICVLADAKVKTREREILRGFCATLGIPVPIF